MASVPNILKRLEGKVALITGGASGIGECTAKLFASYGAKVVVADIQDDVGHSLCNDVIGRASASYVHCDVISENDVKNAVDTVISLHGKLDVMHNNAGIVDQLQPSILDNTLEDFERVLKVDLVGPFLGTKHAARAMIPARSGSIITTASVASVIGGAATHGYVSAKHGALGLTRNAAAELGRYGIRVNCVSPYLVDTPLTREIMSGKEVAKRVYCNLEGSGGCKMEDVAEAVVYLASNEAKYVSGVNLIVDGGFTIMNSGFYVFDESPRK